MQDPTNNLPLPILQSHNEFRLSVVYRPIDTIQLDPGNPRSHSERQIKQITSSIQNFGFINPILVDENGTVIAGHGRYLAARNLGMKEIPVIQLPFLSAAEKKALRIADNKIALNASWDMDQLRLELEEIRTLDIHFDLTLTGFSTGELDIAFKNEIDPDDEVIPEPPSVPKAKLGDIWACGEHRIGCGDARDTVFLQKIIGPGVKVDAVFIDPPYNVKINGHANAKGRHSEFAVASGELSTQEFRLFLKDTLSVCVSVTKSGGVHFICMDWRHALDLELVAEKLYHQQLNLCIWNKSNAGMGALYRSKHELVFVYRVGATQHFNAVELGKHGRNRTNVWDYDSVNSLQGNRREDLEFHPTTKPIAMVADAIRDVTMHGELVLDTFLGSGTTLLACERAGRRFCGLELDSGYVDVAIARWEAMTGKRAVLFEEVTA